MNWKFRAPVYITDMKAIPLFALALLAAILCGCASQGSEVMVDTNSQKNKKVLGPAPEFNANSLGDPTLSGE